MTNTIESAPASLLTYQERKIDFHAVVNVSDWKVKVYTISKNKRFTAQPTLQAVITKLPGWVSKARQSKLPNHDHAIVMVHEAREGVLILFSWWTGGEMLETEIYFADYAQPEVISVSPFGESALMCVWEIEIFAHERKAWINHVLKKADAPDFSGYSNDIIEN